MGQRIHKLLRSKGFAILSLTVIIAIMIGAYFFRQEVETYLAWGLIGLLIGCFLSNATVLLPAPSLLLICQFSLIFNPLLVAAVGSIGSSLGEMMGFLAGRSGKGLIPEKHPGKILSVLEAHPYGIVFIFSLIPLPLFDVVGILSGALRIDWRKFYLACLLGKFIKMAIIGLVFSHIAYLYPDIFSSIT